MPMFLLLVRKLPIARVLVVHCAVRFARLWLGMITRLTWSAPTDLDRILVRVVLVVHIVRADFVFIIDTSLRDIIKQWLIVFTFRPNVMIYLVVLV